MGAPHALTVNGVGAFFAQRESVADIFCNVLVHTGVLSDFPHSAKICARVLRKTRSPHRSRASASRFVARFFWHEVLDSRGDSGKMRAEAGGECGGSALIVLE